MLFVCANAWGAVQPKAPGTSLLDSVSVIQPAGEADQAGFFRLPNLTRDNVSGHTITSDGSTLLLLRFSKPGAAALRLHIEDLHLPQGASLFVYTLDASGQIASIDSPAGNVPDYWTPALTGDSAVVEVDWGNEIPGDIPFRVTELRESESGTPTTQSTAETFKGIYRGKEVTYAVVDGMAVIEGDIVLGRHGQLTGSTKDNGQRDGVGITGSYYRWPNGVIPYSIPPNFPNQQRLKDAIQHWNTMLSGVIRFVPRKNEFNYVNFYVSGGCSSIVGMNSVGAHPVFLGDGCNTGSVIHELGHIVGLWHEQSREDRDEHIKVLWQNVDLGSIFNFSQNIYNGDDLGEYDYNSIMHYPAYSFSINGQPTIQTIPAGIPIGQRVGLSAGDISAVRKMYGAPEVVDTPSKVPESSPNSPGPPTNPGPPAPPVVTTVTVTLQTNPSGQTLRVDGVNYTAPATVTWNVGTAHNIEAIEPLGGSTSVEFVRWSDGGAQSHSVTASTSVTVLKADYSVKYAVATSVSPSTGGTVTVSPASDDGMYAAGSVLNLTANPAAGYCFTNWSSLLSGTPSTTSVTVNSALGLAAYFVPGSVSIGSLIYWAPSGGGTMNIPVYSSGGYCGWSASSYASWVTIVSGARGAGNGTVTIRVAENNTNFARATMVLIGGRGFAITQSPN
jgi:astacin